MTLFDWFENLKKSEPEIKPQQEREIADGLWTKCPNCGHVAYTKDISNNNMVCLECEHHMAVMSDERITHHSHMMLTFQTNHIIVWNVSIIWL